MNGMNKGDRNMEIIKGKTTIKLSEEDREVLNKARDIFRCIYYEVSVNNTLLEYTESEIGRTYNMLDDFTVANDDELVIEEV
jgi:hypothetical protein